MAKKDDWVQIHGVLLKAEDRTAKLPEDTKHCDLQQWTKGFLLEDAEIGEEVAVVTAVGRIVKGTLVDDNPHYTHNYGDLVPEILIMERQLKEFLFGGDK